MVLRWYQAKLAKRPFLTQVATTAVLFGAGDILAQQAVERKGLEKHSWARTARMVGYGGRECAHNVSVHHVLTLAQLSLDQQPQNGIPPS